MHASRLSGTRSRPSPATELKYWTALSGQRIALRRLHAPYSTRYRSHGARPPARSPSAWWLRGAGQSHALCGCRSLTRQQFVWIRIYVALNDCRYARKAHCRWLTMTPYT